MPVTTHCPFLRTSMLLIFTVSCGLQDRLALGSDQVTQASPQPQKSDEKNRGADAREKEIEMIGLRLEKSLFEQLRRNQSDIQTEVLGELKQHREYLQTLDDKFYQRIALWGPVLSAVVIGIGASFAWYFGKTRREAFESVRVEASLIATDIARKQVDQIVFPDSLVARVKEASEANVKRLESLSSELRERLESLSNELRERIELELTTERDKILNAKSKMITEVLDDALREKFSKELNLLERIEELEHKVTQLRSELTRIVTSLDALRDWSDRLSSSSWGRGIGSIVAATCVQGYPGPSGVPGYPGPSGVPGPTGVLRAAGQT